MKQHDRAEDHLLFVIYTVGIVFFLVRVFANLDGTWDEMSSDPAWIESREKICAILEMLITVIFIWSVIPRWVNRIKVTPIQKMVQWGCIIAGFLIIYFTLPGITGKELEFTEMKIVGIAVALVVLAIFYIIAYKYGQKHKKDDGNDNKDDEEAE